MRQGMHKLHRSGLHARTYGRGSSRKVRDGCGWVSPATRPNGRGWLQHSCADDWSSAGSSEQTFDIEMIFDVIGERIEHALDIGAVIQVCGRNIHSCEKCLSKTVRRK